MGPAIIQKTGECCHRTGYFLLGVSGDASLTDGCLKVVLNIEALRNVVSTLCCGLCN